MYSFAVGLEHVGKLKTENSVHLIRLFSCIYYLVANEAKAIEFCQQQGNYDCLEGQALNVLLSLSWVEIM